MCMWTKLQPNSHEIVWTMPTIRSGIRSTQIQTTNNYLNDHWIIIYCIPRAIYSYTAVLSWIFASTGSQIRPCLLHLRWLKTEWTWRSSTTSSAQSPLRGTSRERSRSIPLVQHQTAEPWFLKQSSEMVSFIVGNWGGQVSLRKAAASHNRTPFLFQSFQ